MWPTGPYIYKVVSRSRYSGAPTRGTPQVLIPKPGGGRRFLPALQRRLDVTSACSKSPASLSAGRGWPRLSPFYGFIITNVPCVQRTLYNPVFYLPFRNKWLIVKNDNTSLIKVEYKKWSLPSRFSRRKYW